MVKIIILLVCLLLPTQVFADNLKDVYKSLKKLENKVAAGIAYYEYKDILIDCRTERDMFLVEYNKSDKNLLNDAIGEVFRYYSLAESAWKLTNDRIQEASDNKKRHFKI